MQHTPTGRFPRSFVWHVGVDRNVLCRSWDRFEAAFVVVGVVAGCAALALAAWVGARSHDSGMRTAAEQAATRHQVPAVLVRDAPISVERSEAVATSRVRVQARWQLPGGEPRVGPVAAPPGTPAGAAVPLWVDSSGAPTVRPMSTGQALWEAVFAGVYTALASLVVLVGGFRLLRWRLDRARLSWWGREWARVEPRWTHRRA